uniref:YfiT family bacillithiol transferase n=2 Tax=Roseivirga sp. TaxID=1964215 RepID=UPI004048DC4C
MNMDLRYPIGKFSAPEEISNEALSKAILDIATTAERLKSAVSGMDEAQLNTPYRPEGWTVKQVIHHLADSHMNAYIRFHWTLTENQPRIKAYDEKAWAELPYQNNVNIDTSIQLLSSLHERWVVLLNSLSDTDLDRIYIHPEGEKIYVLRKVALLYAWHGSHHIAHVTALKERMGW